MEKRNRQRIRELTNNIEVIRGVLLKRENEVLSLINPYIRNAEDGTEEDIAKLIEIRQVMLDIQGDHLFRMVTDALKGKETGIAYTTGWVDKETMTKIRAAVIEYDVRKAVASEHEDKMVKFVRQYINRRGGSQNMELLNELIGMLPDCRARYNLMASREYLYKCRALQNKDGGT